MPGKKRRRQTKKQIRTKEKLKRILMENPEITYGELKKQAPEIFEILSPKQILGMIGYLKSPISKVLEPSKMPTRTPPAQAKTPSETPAETPLGESRLPREKPRIEVGNAEEPTSKLKSEEGKVGGTPPSAYVPPSTPIRVSEEVLEVEVTGVPRKIKVSPETLLWYDWFREGKLPIQKKPFEGSLGDFFDLCVKDFFHSRKVQFVIRYEEEVA